MKIINVNSLSVSPRDDPKARYGKKLCILNLDGTIDEMLLSRFYKKGSAALPQLVSKVHSE